VYTVFTFLAIKAETPTIMENIKKTKIRKSAIIMIID
jgi:hypothetical protein